MSTSVVAGAIRALAAPIVTVAAKHGYDISWLIEPEFLGLLVGFLCAVWQWRAKKAAVPLDSPPDHPNP